MQGTEGVREGGQAASQEDVTLSAHPLMWSELRRPNLAVSDAGRSFAQQIHGGGGRVED